MKTIKRHCCVLTGKEDLEDLYTLRNFPVFMGCVDSPISQDIKTNMAWGISRGCGLIQLKELIPLEDLYPQSHGSGCIGKLWDEHHRALACFIHQFKPGAVLELGGAHGRLSKEYQAFDQVPWTIIEPNPTPQEDVKARFIKGFFDEHFCFNEPFDAVVHSHVFEHIYEPSVFMRHLSGFMRQGQYLLFSVPNMQVMLEKKFTNCVNFEHTVFLTEPYIEYLLSSHGFRLIKREYFLEDHSIFYAALRDTSLNEGQALPDLYAVNKALYSKYVQYHERLIAQINQRMQTARQEIFLFGAHVVSQYLLAFGLDAAKISGVLDNDPNKQGKRLYGTDLKTFSPKILAGFKNPTVILRSGVFSQEIKKGILENINANVTFLE